MFIFIRYAHSFLRSSVEQGGPMTTDRNVYTGIHNFTMPGDVAVYILLYR